MAWHPHLSIEVAAEFSGIHAGALDRVEAHYEVHAARKLARWAEHGAWWRKTTRGREYVLGYARAQYARLSHQPGGSATCVVCFGTFDVSALKVKRGRTRVCSVACKGRVPTLRAKRITIGRTVLTLAEWCQRTGVAPGTAYARIERGWAPADAVTVATRARRMR